MGIRHLQGPRGTVRTTVCLHILLNRKVRAELCAKAGFHGSRHEESELQSCLSISRAVMVAAGIGSSISLWVYFQSKSQKKDDRSS